MNVTQIVSVRTDDNIVAEAMTHAIVSTYVDMEGDIGTAAMMRGMPLVEVARCMVERDTWAIDTYNPRRIASLIESTLMGC